MRRQNWICICQTMHVHLNDTGNWRLYKNYRGTVVNAMKFTESLRTAVKFVVAYCDTAIYGKRRIFL